MKATETGIECVSLPVAFGMTSVMSRLRPAVMRKKQIGHLRPMLQHKQNSFGIQQHLIHGMSVLAG